MAAKTPIKSPINRSLLTPCRRVGLCKPKKTPRTLNLDTSSSLAKSLRPLEAPGRAGLNLVSPLARATDNVTPSKTTAVPEGIVFDVSSPITPIPSKVSVTNANGTPLKKQNIKSKKLFANTLDKNKQNLNMGKGVFIDNNLNEFEDNEVNREKINGLAAQDFERNERIVLVNNQKLIKSEEKDGAYLQDLGGTPKQDIKSKNEKLDLSKEPAPNGISGTSQIIANTGPKNSKINIIRKPPIFREETNSMNINQKNVPEASVPLGKFTTAEWLEDEDICKLKENEFDSKKSLKELETHNIQENNKDHEGTNHSSNSEEGISGKRKRRAVQITDSSSDDQIKEEKKGIQDENESDEEFSKEPIKDRRKSSKRTLSSQKHSSKKKIKKEVTVKLHKMAEAEIIKYTGNIEHGDQTSRHLVNVNELSSQVNAMKALLKKKEEVLENLKRAQVYMNKHNPIQIEALSNVWLNGCRLAISDLLHLLKQHGPITMKSLLKKLQISPEILQKLNISTEEES